MKKRRHPLDNQSLKRRLIALIRANCQRFQNSWPEYFELMTDGDAWDEVVDHLPSKDRMALRAAWEKSASCPDLRTVQLFSQVEREVFNKTVEDEL